MKKIFALILAAVMMLCGTAALAETAVETTVETTVETPAQPAAQTTRVQLSVDRETAKTVLTAFGVQDEQMKIIDPALALLGSLGIRVTSIAGGFQVDLDLDGTEMLSLAGAGDDKALTLGSSLFPNYLISVSKETLQGMLQQFMPAMAAGGDTEGGANMNAAFEALMKHMAPLAESFQTAMVPGEAEQGTYEFDGFTFDTKVPMTVDVPAMAEAAKKALTDLLNDPEAAVLFQSVPNFNAEEILKGFEKGMAEENLPDVTVEIYTNSDGSEAYYTISEATYKGKEEPSYRMTMMNKGGGDGVIGFWAFDAQTIIGVNYSSTGFMLDCTAGELWFGLKAETGEGLALDIYVMETEKPLASLKITASAEGERTLSLDPEGKTLVTLEELMSGEASEAMTGLTADIQKTLIPLMSKIVKVAPDAGNLLMMLVMPQGGGQAGGAGTVKTGEPEPADVNPSAWKTLGDVFALGASEMEYGTEGENLYSIIFKYGGKQWLVTADFSEELFRQIMDIDAFAEDRNEQEHAIIDPLEITNVIDLSALALPQEELDQWIGKTGQDLLDAGWEYNGYSDQGQGPVPNMVNGQFEYAVTFSEPLTPSQVFGEMPADFATGVISGVTFNGKSYHFEAQEWLNK